MGAKISGYTEIEREVRKNDLIDISKDNGDGTFSTRRINASYFMGGNILFTSANKTIQSYSLDVSSLRHMNQIVGVYSFVHDTITNICYPCDMQAAFDLVSPIILYEVTADTVDFFNDKFGHSNWQFAFSVNYF